MDIYQILVTHNRPLSKAEATAFTLILLLTFAGAGILLYKKKIGKLQAAAMVALVCFLGVVFASTVFTRPATVRRYELTPLWSWKEIIVNHSREMLKEDLLNCLLLFPMGLLLPLAVGRKLRILPAFLTGFFVSAVIETSQLLLKRGLFEWDDMLHNALGCMLGCLLMNLLLMVTQRGKRK